MHMLVLYDEITRKTKLFVTVDGAPDRCSESRRSGVNWRAWDYEVDFHINGPGNLYVLKVSSIIVF